MNTVNVSTSSRVAAEHATPRLLLVEDDEGLRRALGRTLRQTGHLVVEAGDGREAMDAVLQERFDVILSDVDMPGMDGIHLLRAVRETDLDVPVVLMTGDPDLDTANRAMEYGIFQYLSKPLDMASVGRILEKAIQLHRLARMKRESLEILGREARLAGDRAGLEAGFDRALSTLWMAYQPILHVRSGALYGHEALLRASEPSLPHPGAILDAAEKLDRLHDLGRLVRRTVGKPKTADLARGFLFVNLHARDLEDPTLYSEASPLTSIAERVVLEITERASLDPIRDVRGKLTQLRELGFRIAVDDLGAGYAGLTTFALLEPEIVKLDMSLVRDVHRTATKQKVIRSMTRLCEDMGLLVVAEGVETREERDALVELGCDLLQGYLFARPGAAFPSYVW